MLAVFWYFQLLLLFFFSCGEGVVPFFAIPVTMPCSKAFIIL